MEHCSIHCTFQYLCPKLTDTDIPNKAFLADAILTKVHKLDGIDKQLLLVSIWHYGINCSIYWGHTIWDIGSHVSIIFDKWSTKHCHPYSSISIQYINSPPDNPHLWTLKSHLLTFDHTCGHHTRDMTGQGLVKIIQKFSFEDKVSHNCSLTSIC